MNYLVYRGLIHPKYKGVPEVQTARRRLAKASQQLLLGEWLTHHHVHENYNAATGEGNDVSNSNPFCAQPLVPINHSVAIPRSLCTPGLLVHSSPAAHARSYRSSPLSRCAHRPLGSLDWAYQPDGRRAVGPGEARWWAMSVRANVARNRTAVHQRGSMYCPRFLSLPARISKAVHCPRAGEPS
jgi:hypothetical protein